MKGQWGVTQMHSWTHALSLSRHLCLFFPLPCSLCSCHDCWFARWQDTVSTAQGGSTGRPAGRSSDSSRKVRGSVCTTGPQPADTWDRGRGGLSPGPSRHSLLGFASIFVPVQGKSCLLLTLLALAQVLHTHIHAVNPVRCNL